MKRRTRISTKLRTLALAGSMGTLLQFGACNIGQISASTTIDGREALIALIRGAILTPLDAYITDTVTRLFDDE